jgi:hypothetical protein
LNFNARRSGFNSNSIGIPAAQCLVLVPTADLNSNSIGIPAAHCLVLVPTALIRDSRRPIYVNFELNRSTQLLVIIKTGFLLLEIIKNRFSLLVPIPSSTQLCYHGCDADRKVDSFSRWKTDLLDEIWASKNTRKQCNIRLSGLSNQWTPSQLYMACSSVTAVT